MVDYMTKWGKTDFRNLKKLSNNLDNYIKTTDILESVAKELTARLLGKVIPRTPVGQYPSSSGKVGGTLRRGWTTDTHEQAERGSNIDVNSYVNSIEIKKTGKYVEILIINPVEYASFVERGHRTVGGKGWVNGRHMLRISVNELKNDSPRIIKNRIEKELREVFK